MNLTFEKNDYLIWEFWIQVHSIFEFLFRRFFLKSKFHFFIDNKLLYYEKKYLKPINKIMDLKGIIPDKIYEKIFKEK